MKVWYEADKVRDDLVGVLLISHGKLAKGVYETTAMIVGDLENVSYCCLESSDDLDKFQKKLGEIVESYPAGCIVLADLKGGTPYNRYLMNAMEKNKQIHLLTGMNLPMTIETVTSRENMVIDTILNDAMREGVTGIVNCAKEFEE